MSQSDDRDVHVEINLAGGLRYETVLPAASTALHDLFAALATQHLGAQSPVTLIQVPLDGGRVACSFSSLSLVSVVTHPPVVAAVAQVRPPDVLEAAARPRHVEVESFLTPEENAAVLKYAIENRDQYRASTVTSNDDSYRRSEVLHAIGTSEWRDLFATRLGLLLPHARRTLGIPDFPEGDFEIQLTASNDGAYFKPHADSGDPETRLREVTFVYYVHGEPKRYSGGALTIYGRDGIPSYSIEPRNNALVMFQSATLHEVQPVSCQSRDFADGRFTVNGWFRRRAPELPAMPRRRPGVVAGRVVDDMLLELPGGGPGMWLGPVGRTVWQLCDGTRSPAAIEAEAVRLHPERAKDAASDAATAMRQLQAHGLIEG